MRRNQCLTRVLRLLRNAEMAKMGPAREMAEILDLRLTGTLGLLLDAKKAKPVPAVRPLLEKLQSLGSG